MRLGHDRISRTDRAGADKSETTEVSGLSRRTFGRWVLTRAPEDAWANANRIPVEEDKPEADRGRYLHPELAEGRPGRPLVAVESMERRRAIYRTA